MTLNNTVEDIGGIPQSSAVVHGNNTPVLIQGSVTTDTDGNGNTTTPVNLNLKQVGDVLFALGQALKAGSIPVVLPSDQVVPTLDTNSAAIKTDTDTIATNTTGLATQTTLAAVKTDADTLVTNTTGLATQATLSAAKTDLDTIVTNTNKIPASPATEGGHLAAIDTSTAASKTDLDTLAGIVSSNKAAVKALANDIVDLATLAGIVSAGKASIQQADLSTSGTIQAAQPVIGTPVTNATIQLTVGQGQSTWKALLSDGGGGFTSATTIVADKSVDGGTTWITASFKVSNASPATSVTSVVGPGPLELTGNAAGVTHVRIRCSVRGGTETIAVVLRAGAGVGDIGLLSPIPAGSNEIGAMLLRVATGVALAADQTNSILRTSLYGKNSTAGDTALGLDASGRPTAIMQAVGGTALAVGNNGLPVLNVAATGYVAAFGSNPSALTANTDAAFKWGAGGTTQVNHIMIQNNTAINVNFDLDVATNVGSPILAPGQTIFLDVQTTAVHLQTNGTPNLNGSTASNIVVRGWL